MKKLFIFIILISIQAHATVFECARMLDRLTQSTSGPTESYSALLKSLAQEKNALSPGDLNVILSQAQPVNPFDVVFPEMASVEKFAYKTAFDKVLRQVGATPIDWTRIQIEIREMAGLKASNDKTRSRSKNETAELPIPLLKFSLSSKYKGNQGSPFGLGFWNGKPVLVGHMSRGQEDDEFMIDPSTEKVTKLSGRQIEGRPQTPLRYLEYNGRDYFYRLGYDNMFYSPDLQKNTGLKFSNLERPSDYGPETGFIFVDSNSIYAVRLLQRYGNVGYKLVLANLKDPRQKPKILKEFEGYGMGNFGVDEIDGHPIISYVHSGTNKIFFYDLKTKKAFPLVATDNYNNYAAVYRDGTELRAIFPVIEGYAIADLKTGQIIKRERVPGAAGSHGRIRVVTIDNHLFSYMALDDQMVIIDMESGKYHIQSAKEMTSDVSEFTFHNQKYFTWGTWKGSVEIYDPLSQTIISSQKLFSDKIYQVLPFEMNGRIMALVAQWDEAPAVIQLAGPLDARSQRR